MRIMAAIGFRSSTRPISGCPPSAPRQASAGCRSMTSASTGRRPALPKSSTHCMALSSATGSCAMVRGQTKLDIQWIDAFHKRSLSANAIGPAVTLQEDASVFRIAPGLGYQIYSGAIAGVPITVDGRAGFSVFTWDASAHFEGSPFSGISVSHSFVPSPGPASAPTFIRGGIGGSSSGRWPRDSA